MAKIHPLLELVVKRDATDLHLLQGTPPKLRESGELVPIAGHPPLDEERIREYLHEIISPEQIDRYESTGDLAVSPSVVLLTR